MTKVLLHFYTNPKEVLRKWRVGKVVIAVQHPNLYNAFTKELVLKASNIIDIKCIDFISKRVKEWLILYDESITEYRALKDFIIKEYAKEARKARKINDIGIVLV